jgi:hypothetical protein
MTLPRYTEAEFLEHALRAAPPEVRHWIDAGKMVPRPCDCRWPQCRGWQIDWASPAVKEECLRDLRPSEHRPVTAG